MSNPAGAIKILHITAHLGAGAGKAIAGIAVSDPENRHHIVLLDHPQKQDHILKCEQEGVEVSVCPDERSLRERIRQADVVLFHWWHHPLSYHVLPLFSDIPARLLLWSHVNGLYYPVLDPALALRFDKCLFTSRASLNAPAWTMEERQAILQNAVVIYGTGDFDPYTFPYKQNYRIQEPLRLGYTGSLDYAKLHPSYLAWCKPLLRDGSAHLCLAGDPSEQVRNEIKKRGLEHLVSLPGYCEDIPALLQTFDIFLYLLNPKNFATTENALLEAMAAALPVITSGGEAERAIVSDGINGLVVGNQRELTNAVSALKDNITLRTRLGQEARRTVLREHGKEENIKTFTETVKIVLSKGKKTHDFAEITGETPFSRFLCGCGKADRELFYAARTDLTVLRDADAVFRGNAKGSLLQFAAYDPGDETLTGFCSYLLHEEKGAQTAS